MGKNIIGLDIGGSKITGVVFDGKTVVKDLTIVTPKNLKDFKYSLLNLVKFLSVGKKISGLGVGCAGLINQQQGIVVRSPNLKFLAHFSFKKFFHSVRFSRVEADNDANAFTRAELLLGQGKKYKHFLGVILGTGMGGGIVIDSKIYRGANHFGGEIGKFRLNKENHLEHDFQKFRDRNDYKNLGEIVGIALSNAVHLLDPQAIILGGSVAINASSKFLPYAKHTLRKLLPKQ